MPQAIIYLVGLGFLLVVIYILIHGIEPFAKYSSFIFIISSILFITFSAMLLITNKIHLTNILPILEFGVKPLVIPTLEMTYGIPMGELFIMLMIYQFLNDKDRKKGFRNGYSMILIRGGMFVFVTLLNIFILNPEILEGLNPSMRVWRLLDNDEFIQRFDLIVLCSMIFYSIVKLTILTFGTKHMILNTVTIKKQNIVTILICIVIFLGVYFFSDRYLVLFDLRVKYFVPYVNMIFEIVIPFILVIISFFRKKKAKPNPGLEKNPAETDLLTDQEALEF
jgi:spore germination protein KB